MFLRSVARENDGSKEEFSADHVVCTKAKCFMLAKMLVVTLFCSKVKKERAWTQGDIPQNEKLQTYEKKYVARNYIIVFVHWLPEYLKVTMVFFLDAEGEFYTVPSYLLFVSLDTKTKSSRLLTSSAWELTNEQY